MNILQPWNIFFFASLITYIFTRHIFMNRTKHEEKSVTQIDRLERFLIFLMLPPIMILPALYLFTPFLNFANYTQPTFIPPLGAATMLTALWLFWRSHADLGLNWSISLELRKNHQLITQGVYRSIRHPMYTSIWLWAFAQTLLLQNWIAGPATIPAFAAMYFLRTPREERLMLQAFGEQYKTYTQQTNRLLPRLRKHPTNK